MKYQYAINHNPRGSHHSTTDRPHFGWMTILCLAFTKRVGGDKWESKEEVETIDGVIMPASIGGWERGWSNDTSALSEIVVGTAAPKWRWRCLVQPTVCRPLCLLSRLAHLVERTYSLPISLLMHCGFGGNYSGRRHNGWEYRMSWFCRNKN